MRCKEQERDIMVALIVAGVIIAILLALNLTGCGAPNESAAIEREDIETQCGVDLDNFVHWDDIQCHSRQEAVSVCIDGEAYMIIHDGRGAVGCLLYHDEKRNLNCYR